MDINSIIEDYCFPDINNVFVENKMSSKERNNLQDSDFGIPSERKFPLHDKKHVIQAIKMFSHVDDKHEKELANNIIAKMDQYSIDKDTVGENNRLYKYIYEHIYLLENFDPSKISWWRTCQSQYTSEKEWKSKHQPKFESIFK